MAAGTLLIASKLTDWLEPDLGFDVINLAFSVVVASIATAFLAIAYDVCKERRGRRRAPARATATPARLLTGTAALVVIGVEHLHQLPALDGWLGIAAAW